MTTSAPSKPARKGSFSVRGQQRRGVGADAPEGRLGEGEHAAEAVDEVQADDDHRVHQRHVQQDDAVVAGRDIRGDQTHEQCGRDPKGFRAED